MLTEEYRRPPLALAHLRDTGTMESTTEPRSQGCMVIPAGPGGGVESSAEGDPVRVWPRRSDCHSRPGHGCPG
jgi:hypothetical protein